MSHSEQINELAAALVAAQAEFDTVSKTDTNPFFKSKYAGLPEVMKTAGPVLAKHGLAVSQFLSQSDGSDTLTTWLIHKSGQYINDTMRLHLSKDDAQGQGSATTYARRYSYMAVLGLVADEDDDGNAASKRPAPKHYEKPADKPGLMKPGSQTRMRALLTEKGLTGEKAQEFALFIIGKEAPSNEGEVQQLIQALEAQ